MTRHRVEVDRGRKHRSVRLLVAVVIPMVLAVGACGSSDTAGPSAVDVGLETMEGMPTSIAENLSERPLLVSLWAVWCQPCRRELPELQKISIANAGVDVLAVNVGDDPQRITQYLTEMSLDLPVSIDPLGDLLTALDVSTVPATVLFGPSGSILWSHLGAVSVEQVDAALREFVPA